MLKARTATGITITLLPLFLLSSSLGQASLWVAPDSFNVDIIEGRTATYTLKVGNSGMASLSFTVRNHVVSNTEGKS